MASDPPEAFDFDAYLDFFERHRYNFIPLHGLGTLANIDEHTE